jgi:hypothetical protein
MRQVAVFGIVKPWNLKKSRCFGGIYRFHLQGRRVRQEKIMKAVSWLGKWCLSPGPSWFLAWFTLRPWRRRYIPPKHRAFSELHCFTTRKTAFYTATAVTITITVICVNQTFMRSHMSLPVNLYQSYKDRFCSSKMFRLIPKSFHEPT